MKLIVEDTNNDYTFDDIIDSISQQLGFELVRNGNNNSGYYTLGLNTRLNLNMDNDKIVLRLSLPSPIVDMSDNVMIANQYIEALNCSIEIYNIIDVMVNE